MEFLRRLLRPKTDVEDLENEEETTGISLLYGLESVSDLKLADEIVIRKQQGLPLDDLQWGSSDNPLHPANNPHHPLYIPKKRRSRKNDQPKT
jgi:hypothetical protein